MDRSGLGVVGGCAEDEPTPSLECVEIGGQQRDRVDLGESGDLCAWARCDGDTVRPQGLLVGLAKAVEPAAGVSDRDPRRRIVGHDGKGWAL